jgi:2-amino-4-hydroxy-6-hydroxymethyldihydropteridine diphosphokinase
LEKSRISVEGKFVAWVYVSIGSNVDRYQHITASLNALSEHFGELLLSRVYESESVGFAGDNFLNLAAGFNCEMEIADLSCLLRRIEHDNGRRRDGPKFGSRTLDIDILTYDNVVDVVAGVELPREEITKNAFVLLPLVDIGSEKKHPSIGKTYAQLWDEYDQGKQKLWPVSFQWQGQSISSPE